MFSTGCLRMCEGRGIGVRGSRVLVVSLVFSIIYIFFVGKFGICYPECPGLIFPSKIFQIWSIKLTFLISAGYIQRSKYFNTPPFSSMKQEVENNSENVWNIKKTWTMTGMSRIEKDKFNKIKTN